MDDMVSRQAVLELTMQYCPDDDGTCSKAGSDIRELLDDIEHLPSAQPEVLACGEGELSAQPQRTGRWIEDDDEMFVICSECGEKNDYISAYCPDCGARMEGEG